MKKIKIRKNYHRSESAHKFQAGSDNELIGSFVILYKVGKDGIKNIFYHYKSWTGAGSVLSCYISGTYGYHNCNRGLTIFPIVATLVIILTHILIYQVQEERDNGLLKIDR